MQLKEGIKIYIDTPLPEDRIYLSNGLKAMERTYRGMQCLEGGFMPQKPWRKPNNEERNLLFAPSETQMNYRETVGIVKLPSEIITYCQKMPIAEADSEDAFKAIQQNQTYDYMALTSAIDAFVDQYASSLYDRHCIGFHLGNPGFEVGTIDSNTGQLIGLHIDSWDKLPTHEAINATNRICFNMGSEDRYFLMINQSLEAIAQMLHQKDASLPASLEQYTRPQLLKTFFKNYPEYPAIRIRLKPYEAYIAPTENIIHDGDLSEKVAPDVTYTIRGYLDVQPKTLENIS
ncbi:MAG TPA: hypothetical protein DCS93_13485 [Microscillaceae bacterium]|nr:hypothetical protein [Microscillaceae bacterium]